jgi:hypothetical protein
MSAFVFNANEFEPSFGSGNKLMPVNKLLVMIETSNWVETKNHDGEYISAEYVALEGPQKGIAITHRFNLHNNSVQAVEIAQKELSGLCHVTGVYNLSAPDGAPPLLMMHNKPFRIDVGWQKGQEPCEERPNGGYTEVKAVYDANGNRPGAGSYQGTAVTPAAPLATPITPNKKQWVSSAKKTVADNPAPTPPWSPKR